MIIGLTDGKRYELEKDNVISIILSAARSGTEITAEDIGRTLNIDQETTNKLITALRNDGVIK